MTLTVSVFLFYITYNNVNFNFLNTRRFVDCTVDFCVCACVGRVGGGGGGGGKREKERERERDWGGGGEKLPVFA